MVDDHSLGSVKTVSILRHEEMLKGISILFYFRTHVEGRVFLVDLRNQMRYNLRNYNQSIDYLSENMHNKTLRKKERGDKRLT